MSRAQQGHVELGQVEREEGGEGGGELQPGQLQVVPRDVQCVQLGQAGGVLGTLRGEVGEVGQGEVQGGQPGAGGQLAQGDRQERIEADTECLEMRESCSDMFVLVILRLSSHLIQEPGCSVCSQSGPGW